MLRKAIAPAFVEFVPGELDEGVLYISKKYQVAVHLCCCGCEEKVVTPLSPAEWTVYGDEKVVSLRPSVGNWGMACRSHYCITNNKIIPARKFSKREIEAVRARDGRDLTVQIQMRNSQYGLIANIKKLWRRAVSIFHK